MAYSRITGTRNGADAIDYGRGKGKGHNNKKVRNMVISEVNMFPETVLSYEKQMQKYWNKASAKNKNQVHELFNGEERMVSFDDVFNGWKRVGCGGSIQILIKIFEGLQFGERGPARMINFEHVLCIESVDAGFHPRSD